VREVVDVRGVTRGGAGGVIFKQVLHRRERTGAVEGHAAVGHDEVNDPAGSRDPAPFGERGRGVGDVLEHVRGDDVIERMVVERQGAGVSVIVGEAGFSAKGLEAVDVDGARLQSRHRRGTRADLDPAGAAADPV